MPQTNRTNRQYLLLDLEVKGPQISLLLQDLQTNDIEWVLDPRAVPFVAQVPESEELYAFLQDQQKIPGFSKTYLYDSLQNQVVPAFVFRQFRRFRQKFFKEHAASSQVTMETQALVQLNLATGMLVEFKEQEYTTFSRQLCECEGDRSYYLIQRSGILARICATCGKIYFAQPQLNLPADCSKEGLSHYLLNLQGVRLVIGLNPLRQIQENGMIVVPSSTDQPLINFPDEILTDVYDESRGSNFYKKYIQRNLSKFSTALPQLDYYAYDIETAIPESGEFPSPHPIYNRRTGDIELYGADFPVTTISIAHMSFGEIIERITIICPSVVQGEDDPTTTYDLSGITIIKVDFEGDLLLKFAEIVQERGGIWLSYNGDNFDMYYLYARARNLNDVNADDFPIVPHHFDVNAFEQSLAPKFQTIIKEERIMGETIKRETTKVIFERRRGRPQFDFAPATNAIHIDLYRFFSNHSLKASAFKSAYSDDGLDDVIKAFLGEVEGKKSAEIDKPLIEYGWQELTYYCQYDADVLPLIMKSQNAKPEHVLLICLRLVPLGIRSISRFGISRWLESIFDETYLLENWLIPAHSTLEDLYPWPRGKKYPGAMVLNATCGVFLGGISVLDYSSLYPTILHRYEIGPTTVCNCTCSDPESHFSIRIHPDNLEAGINNSDLRSIAPLWICSNHEDLSSIIIGAIRNSRILLFKPLAHTDPAEMPPEIIPDGSDASLVKMLAKDIESVLKVFINAAYGSFGSPYNRYNQVGTAISIPAIGRYCLIDLSNVAKHFPNVGEHIENRTWGLPDFVSEEDRAYLVDLFQNATAELTTVRGDTDSIFVPSPDPETFHILKEYCRIAQLQDLEEETPMQMLISCGKIDTMIIKETVTKSVQDLTGEIQEQEEERKRTVRQIMGIKKNYLGFYGPKERRIEGKGKVRGTPIRRSDSAVLVGKTAQKIYEMAVDINQTPPTPEDVITLRRQIVNLLVELFRDLEAAQNNESTSLKIQDFVNQGRLGKALRDYTSDTELVQAARDYNTLVENGEIRDQPLGRGDMVYYVKSKHSGYISVPHAQRLGISSLDFEYYFEDLVSKMEPLLTPFCRIFIWDGTSVSQYDEGREYHSMEEFQVDNRTLGEVIKTYRNKFCECADVSAFLM